MENNYLFECKKCDFSSNDFENFVFYGGGDENCECKDCYAKSIDETMEMLEN